MNIKKIINVAIVFGLSTSMVGCGTKQEAAETPESTPTPTPTPDPYAAPSGKYFSETTGLPITTLLQDQRPTAVMVDCEYIALPHYGIGEADIVYDMINNVYNDRITRFMAVYKDWTGISQIGNVRSARTTNVWLAGEWNAILIHDGEAHYAAPYLEEPYASQNLSSGFSRIANGKNWEFTEYVMAGEVAARMQEASFDINYNQYKQEGDHFKFVKYTTTLNTAGFQDAVSVSEPFPHNETALTYNAATQSYDLSMYGALHTDAEDGQVLTFTNVLLLDCPFTEYPDGGYVYYNILDASGAGYYLTNGKMEPITWKKGPNETDITHYYDANGNELEMNRGKSYISYIPSDSWTELAIQ